METSDQILKALNWRYAVKKFDADRRITPKDWWALQEVIRLTPSSYGLQPWKFILVENPSVRAELRKFSRDQAQVTDCSHYLVITHLAKINESDVREHTKNLAQVRGLAPDKAEAYQGAVVANLLNGRRAGTLNHWAERQTYIVMGQAMTAAALMGIDTCPMEGIEPEQYDRILNLKGTGYQTVATLAFGYRHADDKYASLAKVRFPLEKIFREIR